MDYKSSKILLPKTRAYQSKLIGMMTGDFYPQQILSEALLECHKSSLAAGKPLALKVFISGRNRLENEGAIALSSVFKVILQILRR